MTAREWLAKRAELEGAATDGPWAWDKRGDLRPDPHDEYGFDCLIGWDPIMEVPVLDEGDAAFIADARTSALAMRKALEAVLELHQPTCSKHSDRWPCDKHHPSCAAYCETCFMEAPCATFAEVTAALGVAS